MSSCFLIYHTRVCEFYILSCSTALCSSFFVSIRIHLFGIQFSYYPSARTVCANHFTLETGFAEYHSKSVEGHGFLDRAFDDEFVGDLGGGHEGTVSIGRDIEIDGKELFLVLLCPESLIMGLEGIDIVEIKPLLETDVNKVSCLRVDALIRLGSGEGVLDGLDMEG